MNTSGRLLAGITGAALILVGLNAPPAVAATDPQVSFDSCVPGGTVKLGGNVETATQLGIIEGKNCTLDLNGFELAAYGVRIDAGATLKVIDSSADHDGVLSTGPINSSFSGIEVSGNLQIFSGTVSGGTYNGGDLLAGVRIRSTGTLTISGGSLNATGSYYRGVGIRNDGTADNALTISGGTVTATSKSGIVGSGDVLISGGTVDATATGGGAGIGCASGESCAGLAVTISGGTVTATANEGAGIGGGDDSSGAASVEITGGTVDATAVYGAGIGGAGTATVPVRISGATTNVTAESSVGAAIGGGENTGGDVTITGGTVTASGTGGGAGIGGGAGAAGGSVTISGGNVTAESPSTGAAIGGGAGGAGGTIAISAGTVTATGGAGAGIGGGYTDDPEATAGAGGTITISGGTVTATGEDGAGIGGGSTGYWNSASGKAGDGGTLTITGGTVTAESAGGAGIGGGRSEQGTGGSGGTVSISGNAVVSATSDGIVQTGWSGNEYYIGGAGIGGGLGANLAYVYHSGNGGTLAVAGSAKVTAYSAGGAGVGGGYTTGSAYGAGANVTVSGTSTLTATGKEAGMGCPATDYCYGGTLVISGTAKVTAAKVAGASSSNLAAGPFGKAGYTTAALSLSGGARLTVNGPLAILDRGTAPQAKLGTGTVLGGTGTMKGGGRIENRGTITLVNSADWPVIVTNLGSAAKAPSAPSIKASVGDRQLVITFKKPKSGGAEITNFEYSITDGKTWVTPDPAVTASPLTITGLTNGTSYRIRVRSVNNIGTSKASNRATAKPAGKPLTPEIASVTAGDRKLTVRWTAPNSNGSKISRYTVTATAGAWHKSVKVTGSKRSASITKLTNGTTYTITITARNGRGTSAASTAVEAKPVGPPGAPSAVRVVPAAGALDVSWTAPSRTGGEALTGYTVTAKLGKASFRCQSAELTCSITGLTPGKRYTVTVTATNGLRTSSASKSVKARPLAL